MTPQQIHEALARKVEQCDAMIIEVSELAKHAGTINPALGQVMIKLVEAKLWSINAASILEQAMQAPPTPPAAGEPNKETDKVAEKKSKFTAN